MSLSHHGDHCQHYYYNVGVYDDICTYDEFNHYCLAFMSFTLISSSLEKEIFFHLYQMCLWKFLDQSDCKENNEQDADRSCNSCGDDEPSSSDKATTSNTVDALISDFNKNLGKVCREIQLSFGTINP